MPDTHLAEHLHGNQPALPVLLGEATSPHHPRGKDVERREEVGQWGRGLVVQGDSQVGIDLTRNGLWAVRLT